jgi:hypothetical protein
MRIFLDFSQSQLVELNYVMRAWRHLRARATSGHVLARAELIGTYENHGR